MRLIRSIAFRAATLLLTLVGMTAHCAAEGTLKLWYERPAAEWTEALPIGNGRLGGMVYGGTVGSNDKSKFALDERIQFNEDTFWAGQPYDPNRPEAWKYLNEVRRLIFEEKLAEAHMLLDREMMGQPRGQMPYQPVGDLQLRFPKLAGKSISNYRRELDLRKAVATTTYTVDGVQFTQQIFSSAADQVIVVKLSADRSAQINVDASFASPHESPSISSPASDELSLTVQGRAHNGVAGGLRCHARLRVIATGGKTSTGDKSIQVTDAHHVTLLLTAATNFISYQDITGNPEQKVEEHLTTAAAKPYKTAWSDHLATYQPLFDRVTLDLGVTQAASEPTNRRIKQFAKVHDPQLVELYFQYGRYLLISSSRPGCMPANLQGIWNDKLNPPWQSKYTCNINAEMNYWPAEPTNLSECHEPLFEMIRGLAESGRRTAQAFYNAPGWVMHHNTDIWLATAPIDGPAWGSWPMGGAWLCQHLWYRYEYTLDEDFLRSFYPTIKGAAEFYLATLVEDPRNKYLVTCPSISPENRILHDKRIPAGVSICAGPTMDNQLLRDLLSHSRQAAELLGTDDNFCKRLQAAEERLPPMKVGKAGQLQEWQQDRDLDVPALQHRHVSHLYGLHPSDQITKQRTPELFAAARKSLELRGDGGTGWSKAWKINFWARLLDGDRSYKLLESLITTGTYPNMFDSHPPFQVDGNFGGTAGIAEMLLQSYAVYEAGQMSAYIHVLPALPSKLPTGKVTGLRARGGFEINIAWQDNQLSEVTIKSLTGAPCIVKYRDAKKSLVLDKDESQVISADEFHVGA